MSEQPPLYRFRHVWVYGLIVSVVIDLVPIVRYLWQPEGFEQATGYSPAALAMQVAICFLFGRFFSLLYTDSLGAFSHWFHRQPTHWQIGIRALLFLGLTELFFQWQIALTGPVRDLRLIHLSYYTRHLARFAAVYGFWYYLKLIRQTNLISLENEQLKRLEVKSQLDVLNNQLNPHFLFNALNILNITIASEPEKAQEIVHNLSDVLRYNLKIQKQTLVRLSEELEVARAFLELYKVRFGDKMQFNFEGDATEREWFVVPLSLQLLIENAVKHNVITPDQVLHIEVKVDETAGELVVTNSSSRKPQAQGLGIGLRNLNKRYELITGRAATQTENSEQFTVTIPIIKLP